MIEKQIENAVSIHAKKTGWLSYKFTSPSSMGVPDRIYIKNRLVIFIEFKSKGKWVRAKQAQVIENMRRHGAQVFIVDDVDEGITILDEFSKYEI